MILFKHVLKEYLRFVFGTIILCVFLFVLFDFMHKTTKYFPKYQPGGLEIAKFYLYQLPYQIMQALPIASLLASVISMVILSRGNEITVMRAAGMNPFVIGSPLAFGGIILSLFSLFISEFVIPHSSKKMHYIQDISIEKRQDNAIDEGVRWVRDKNRLFHFSNFDPKTATLEGVTLLEVDSKFRPKKSTHAESATYSFEQGNWALSDVRVFSFYWNGTVKNVEYQKNSLAFLPIDPKKLQKERRLPAEMGVKELGQVILRGENSGKDVLKEKIAWHLKWSYPFAAFFVSLLGFKFAYRSERSNEAVRKILLAFMIGISYWFILSAARALGTRGDISPFVAAWSANFVIFFVTIFQIFQVRKV